MHGSKRFLSLILTAVFVCIALNAVSATAIETAPSFYIGNYDGSCGDYLSVPVEVKNNPGIAAIKLKITYDSSRLELLSISYGNWSGNFQQPQRMTSPVSLTWYNGIENYTVSDSVFATLTFRILENAQIGDAVIDISYDPNNVYNILENNITFAITAGAITVKSPQTCSHTNLTHVYNSNGNGTHVNITKCTTCSETISESTESCYDADLNNKCDKCAATLTPQNKPFFEINLYNGVPGDTVQIPVMVKNNPGIAAVKLKIAYDSSKLELLSVAYGAWGGNFQQPQRMTSPVSLTWYNGEENYMVKDSAFATLTFRVLKSAQPGNASINITYDPNNVYNIVETNIEFDIHNGGISVLSGQVDIDLAEISTTTASVVFTNNTNSAVTSNLCVALYNSDGKMIGVNFKSYTLNPKDIETIVAQCPTSDEIATIRGFVLSEEAFSPLASVWEYRITD